VAVGRADYRYQGYFGIAVSVEGYGLVFVVYLGRYYRPLGPTPTTVGAVPFSDTTRRAAVTPLEEMVAQNRQLAAVGATTMTDTARRASVTPAQEMTLDEGRSMRRTEELRDVT
jgi:hypothetical protein